MAHLRIAVVEYIDSELPLSKDGTRTVGQMVNEHLAKAASIRPVREVHIEFTDDESNLLFDMAAQPTSNFKRK